MKCVVKQPTNGTPTMLMYVTVTLMEKIDGDWRVDECTFDARNIAVGPHSFHVTLPDGDIFGVEFDDYIVQACAW